MAEFTTTASDSDKNLNNAALIKKAKYFDPLQSRSTAKKVFLCILVVIPSKVMCNLDWDQNLIDELCYRYIVSREIMQEISNMGLYARLKEP